MGKPVPAMRQPEPRPSSSAARRDELIHGLWTAAANQVAQNNRVPIKASELALAQRPISELRQLASRIDAHADAVLALATQIVHGGQN